MNKTRGAQDYYRQRNAGEIDWNNLIGNSAVGKSHNRR